MGRVFGGRLLRRNCEPEGHAEPARQVVAPPQSTIKLPPRPIPSSTTPVPKNLAEETKPNLPKVEAQKSPDLSAPVPKSSAETKAAEIKPPGAKPAPVKATEIKPTEPKPTAGKPAAGKSEPLTNEAKAAEAKAEADKVEARLKASAQGRPLNPRTEGGAAFTRFLRQYQANVSTALPSQNYIAAQTGLSESQWGSRVVFTPKDPNRPGVIISSTKQSEPEVEKVVTELRNSTTASLVTGALFSGGYKDTRANSILVARAGDYFAGVLKDANAKLSWIPYYAAAESEQQAINEAPGRNDRVASRRTERAARGGLGQRRFNGGLSDGLAQTQASASTAVSDTTKLIVQRAKQQAHSGASEVEEKAKEVGKQAELVGYEIDFEGKRQDGVEYFVKTTEGKLYTLKHVGRNFQDPKGEFLPAPFYGRFNVEILRSYEKNGGMSGAEFHRIAMKHNLFPTSDGNIVYVDPTKRNSEKQTELRASLEKIYSEQGGLTSQDVTKTIALHSEKPKEPAGIVMPRPPKPTYDPAPVAIESALANTRVGAVQSTLSPAAHQVFKEAAAQGISVRVVGRQGDGENLSFTYAFIKKDKDASGRVVEREVGQRIALKRFGSSYRTDNDYFKVRDAKLAQELASRLGSTG